jgi:hypothetical protein
MTCHRLMHCRPDELVRQLSRRPGIQWQPPDQVIAVWLPPAARSGRTVVGWHERCPGTRSMVVCCLEVERGATGIIAHLSVSSVRRTGRFRSLPRAMSSIIVKAWTARLLADLAVGVEADRRGTSNQHRTGAIRGALPASWAHGSPSRTVRKAEAFGTAQATPRSLPPLPERN